MAGDYIKLNRKMLDWEWYRNEHTKNVFLHCLLKANWKDCKFEGEVIKKGSFVSSISKISFELNLTQKEVRTSINHLKRTGELAVKTTNKYSVFTVNNYSLYQQVGTQNGTQTADEGLAESLQTSDKGQSEGSQRATIEERKNIKKGRIIPPISPMDCLQNFLAAYPGKANEYQTGAAYVDICLTGKVTESDLVASAVNYAEACRILETDEQYIKRAENFLRDMTFEEYLPDKYQPPKPKQKQQGKADQYNQFMKTGYDYDALEKELLQK